MTPVTRVASLLRGCWDTRAAEPMSHCGPKRAPAIRSGAGRAPHKQMGESDFHKTDPNCYMMV